MKRFAHFLSTACIAILAAGAFSILNERGGVLQQPDLLSIGQQYVPTRASAAQGSTCMPTTGTVSGLIFAQAVNAGMAALQSSNSGNTAPTNDCSAAPVKGQWWVDTSATPNLLKQYNGTQWVSQGALDTIWAPPIGGGIGTLASAGTTDLGLDARAYLNVTGSATITSFGNSAETGTIKYLKFSAPLTITHNAASLIIPGGFNMGVLAGDQITVAHLGAGNWGVTSVTRSSGEALINPAVEVGGYQMFGGFDVPTANYLTADGSSVLRADYPTLLARLTKTQNGTRASGNPIITAMGDTGQFGVGMAVEGIGLQANSVIVSKTSTTITLNAGATSSGTSPVTVFATGPGNGTTTFNLPNCLGRVLAGQETTVATGTVLAPSYFNLSSHGSSQLGALGGQGGGGSVQLLIGNLPLHGHGGTTGNENQSHTHSGQTANDNASHTHSGATGTESVGHSHVYLFPASGGAFGSGGPAYWTGASNVSLSTGTESAAHTHSFSTGTQSTNHQHTYTSGGVSASHFHAITAQGSDTPFGIIQPTIIAKCLIRVL